MDNRIIAFFILVTLFAFSVKVKGYTHLGTDTIRMDSLSRIPVTVLKADSVASGFLKSQVDSGSLDIDSLLQNIISPDSLLTDSLLINPVDTLLADSLSVDSLQTTTKKKSMLDADVNFTSMDSAIYTSDGFMYLYTNSAVKYMDMTLTSDVISLNVDSSIVNAYSRPDSVGKPIMLPAFDDKGTKYESNTIRYNFDTGKGMISNVVTQQGEGFVTGQNTKKLANDDLNMRNARYTTCDRHDCPHFYFNLTKAKVRPKKWIVTGPAYLVFADVPLPLILPFGFFPFSESYSSGVIMPTYADEMNRGFGLRDGGYYFAISDYMDLALTGEVYTKGSWGINAQSRYNKRYKYSGSFNLSRIVTITGEKNMPDYSEATDFRIAWTHRQDPKANPYRTLSANVNYSTSTYDRNNMNSYYNAGSFTQNTKSSSVNLTQRFPESPLTMSLNAAITQQSKEAKVSVTLPDFTASVSSITPFKRKEQIGKERWYEKIRMGYTGHLKNSITTTEDELLKSSLIKDWRNGIQHSIPISATFNVLNYINVTPSISYTERWYSSKVNRSWDNANNVEVRDTIWGFNRVYNYNFSLALSTKLYGFYTPIAALGGKRIETIRHMFTPQISLSAAPDFGAKHYGYVDSYTYTDKLTGEERTQTYNKYDGSLWGAPGSGKSGTINFSFANNVEMKLRPSAKDTSTVSKKISLIDNFTMGISYNMAADSLKWSDINASLRLKLSKSFTLNLSGLFETYTYQLNEDGNPVKVNVTEWEKNRIPGRLVRTGTAFNYTLSNETFKRFKKKKTEEKPPGEALSEEDELLDENGNALTEEEIIERNQQKLADEKKNGKPQLDEFGYQEFSLPWSIGFNYTMSYGKDNFNKNKLRYNMKITHNLGLSGSLTLTPNWRLTASGNVDMETKKLAYMTCSISRDLHCWQMSASFVPVGPYKSYNFLISIKSSLLKDVKYQQRSNYRDNIQWN